LLPPINGILHDTEIYLPVTQLSAFLCFKYPSYLSRELTSFQSKRFNKIIWLETELGRRNTRVKEPEYVLLKDAFIFILQSIFTPSSHQDAYTKDRATRLQEIKGKVWKLISLTAFSECLCISVLEQLQQKEPDKLFSCFYCRSSVLQDALIYQKV
jgi:hypothetical protein